MKRFYLLGFLALMSFDTMTQISSKLAALAAEPLDISPAWAVRIFSSPWVYLAFAGYIGSFVCWLTLLRYAPVGPSFAVSHLELVSVTILSVWLFQEPLNAWKICGGILIILGVLCLAGDGAQRSAKALKAGERGGP